MEEQIKGAEPLDDPRHEKFCQELLANPRFSIADAGKLCGYKHRQNSWDVYKLQSVQDRLNYLKVMRMDDLRIDQYYVVLNLKEIAEKAFDEGEFSAANKANELLGKHTGLFTERVEHKHSGEVTIKSAKEMTDDELAAIAAGSSTGASS